MSRMTPVSRKILAARSDSRRSSALTTACSTSSGPASRRASMAGWLNSLIRLRAPRRSGSENESYFPPISWPGPRGGAAAGLVQPWEAGLVQPREAGIVQFGDHFAGSGGQIIELVPPLQLWCAIRGPVRLLASSWGETGPQNATWRRGTRYSGGARPEDPVDDTEDLAVGHGRGGVEKQPPVGRQGIGLAPILVELRPRTGPYFVTVRFQGHLEDWPRHVEHENPAIQRQLVLHHEWPQ